MTMTLRLDHERESMLTYLANKRGVSKNEAVAQAVAETFRREERNEQLEAALTDTMNRYADTLRRLGE